MSRRVAHVLVAGLGALLALMPVGTSAQTLSFAEVQASGASPLNAEQALALVSGAWVRYTPLVGGQYRRWQLRPDGRLTASYAGSSGAIFDVTGRWFVRGNGLLCVTINWTAMNTENWCRLIYPLGEAHFIFGSLAKPETQGSAYYFTK